MARPSKSDAYAQKQREQAVAKKVVASPAAPAEAITYAECHRLLDAARKANERRMAEEEKKREAEAQAMADAQKAMKTWQTSVQESVPQSGNWTEGFVTGLASPTITSIYPTTSLIYDAHENCYKIYDNRTGQTRIFREHPKTVHKAGHFPINWMLEANERADQSDKLIRIQLEKDGVVVIGTEGNEYETHTLTWAMMDKAEVNPLILAIETVEKHLSTLGRLKDIVANGKQRAA